MLRACPMHEQEIRQFTIDDSGILFPVIRRMSSATNSNGLAACFQNGRTKRALNPREPYRCHASQEGRMLSDDQSVPASGGPLTGLAQPRAPMPDWFRAFPAASAP